MKKLLTLIMACVLAVAAISFTACGSEKGKTVKEGDKIVIGVTDYKPMDYLEDGKWVGFDAELAEKVFTALGYTIEFKEIDWDTKIVTLNAGTIDVIWNGMTVTDELLDNLLLTNVYLKNQQVAVVKAENADNYKTVSDIAGKKVAVESGSAAESAVSTLNASEVSKLSNQNSAILNVSAGQSEVAVVDYSLAKALTAEGTDYYGKLVMKDIGFEVENFSAACRKSDSKLLWQINEELGKLEADGTIAALAEKYGIANQLPSNWN